MLCLHIHQSHRQEVNNDDRYQCVLLCKALEKIPTTDTVNLSIIIVITIKTTSGKTLEIENIGFHYEQCFWRKRFIPSHSEMRNTGVNPFSCHSDVLGGTCEKTDKSLPELEGSGAYSKSTALISGHSTQGRTVPGPRLRNSPNHTTTIIHSITVWFCIACCVLHYIH